MHSFPPSLKTHRADALRPALRSTRLVVGLLLVLFSLAACNRFKTIKTDYVYVSARQVYLHDRVAAVSNRVALVTNGEALEVVERGKRFYRVRTPKGEVGWLEEHAVIDSTEYAQFQDLAKKHGNDPVVAQAQLRDDLYLHVAPGRDTEHFLLIPANAKLDLLARGTVARTTPGQAAPKPKPPIASQPAAPRKSASPAQSPTQSPAQSPTQSPAQSPTQSPAQSPSKSGSPAIAPKGTLSKQATPPTPPTPPAPLTPPAPQMEDWWLVRDASGHTGWLLAGRLDVDIPEEVGGYAEGARMVGAYPLAKVMDSGVEHKAEKKSKNGKPTKPAESESLEPEPPVPTEHIEYVTVLAPLKGGLPYDFDQLRVFTWSLNHHRYETGFRMRNIQGYLPVTIGQETAAGQTYPTFSFSIASGANVNIDPDTGVTRPANPRTIVFRLEGNLVKRAGLDQAPINPLHDADHPDAQESAKARAAAKKKKH